MKNSLPPGAIAAILAVVVIAAVFFGYRYMNGGADGDVTQARINMYKNAKGATGGPAGSGASAAAPGANSTSH